MHIRLRFCTSTTWECSSATGAEHMSQCSPGGRCRAGSVDPPECVEGRAGEVLTPAPSPVRRRSPGPARGGPGAARGARRRPRRSCPRDVPRSGRRTRGSAAGHRRSRHPSAARAVPRRGRPSTRGHRSRKANTSVPTRLTCSRSCWTVTVAAAPSASPSASGTGCQSEPAASGRASRRDRSVSTGMSARVLAPARPRPRSPSPPGRPPRSRPGPPAPGSPMTTGSRRRCRAGAVARRPRR